DGEYTGSAPSSFQADTTQTLFIGKPKSMDSEYFNGWMDDLRVFNKQLSQTEISQFKNRTVNSDAEGLAGYWKFDEGIGSKAFDLASSNLTMHLCGAEWTDDAPGIMNGAVTDASGTYKVEGINYGGGETFTVEPSKISYSNYALEFNSVAGQYVVLPDSILFGEESASYEIRLNNFENTSDFRTVLSKQSSDGGQTDFKIDIVEGNILAVINGDEYLFGVLGTGYQHLVFTFESSIVSLYKNAVLLNEFVYGGNPNASANGWLMGASRTTGGYHQYFSGLIDELAFYNSALDIAHIEELFTGGTNAQIPGLASWFPLNESMGATSEDIGISRTGDGTIEGATWSTVTGISDFFPHEFQPDKRLVTLNANSTSADQIDFTDLSTIPVTGFVRYDGTFCYADSVEILVNGLSQTPPIYTDASGKFTADFEPGATVLLSPKLENHDFSPVSWELKNLNAPVAGIIFRDVTKRDIVGQISGGFCHLSVLDVGQSVEITVQSLDECYSRVIELNAANNADGKFVIKNLPPIEMSIAVSDHDDPTIKDYFADSGGESMRLAKSNDTVDFVFYAQPNVEIDTFAKNACGLIHLEQYSTLSTKIKVYEQYTGGRCYQDTFLLKINDFISDKSQVDTLVTDGVHKLKVYPGVPRLDPPHTKQLEVTGIVNGRIAPLGIIAAVVTGERPRTTSFASTMPDFPLMILRDPPGDGSHSYIEKGQTFCKDWSFETVDGIGGGGKNKISLGAKFTIGVGIGVWKADEIEVKAETTTEFDITRTQKTSTSEEVCLTTNERISTSSGQDVVGEQGGDVYVGVAMNVIFGKTDVLKYNEETCGFDLDTSFIINPDKFLTTYVYSEYQLKTKILPDFLELHDSLSYASWTAIIEQNEQFKKDAIFERNISFDAGVVYEYFVKKDSVTSSSFVFDKAYTDQVGVTAGFELGGIGLESSTSISVSTANSNSQSQSQSSTVQVGYVLADDDTGDFFSVTVKNDKRYGTPVFKTESGTSSCPWEPNTQNRDEVSITVDRAVAINVPANDAALFKFTLGNISQSQEARPYILKVANGSNPDGAVIKVNGQPLTSGIRYNVDFLGGQDVTVTVERGPGASPFTYKGLEITWYAECEFERSFDVAFPLDDKFFTSRKLDVYFLEPCSPVNINSPNNGEVITPGDDDILPIRMVEYNRVDTDLLYISTQYRRANANGVWVNIAQTPRADLDPVFETIEWNTAGFSDGYYEIRAISTCQSGQNPGISKVVTVQFERTAPQLLGTPEPADGILSKGDEISIAFNENINCLKVFPADIFDNNTIGLYDTHTGKLVDATISCLDNKIVIIPNVANSFIEGKILRVQVDSIQDMAGNEFDGTEWEFFVDRGPIQLEGGDLDVVVYQGEEKTIFRTLINTGGSIANYDLDHTPVWVKINPQSGSLSPGGEVEMRFKFEDDLPQGEYLDTLYFSNSQGDERVIIHLRVLCPPPNWVVNSAQYPQTMNFILRPNIEGDFSVDEEDIVSAFINGELRGRQNLTFEPLLGEYVAYLTVYGDNGDFEAPVDIQLWDASECLHYKEVIESFKFTPNGVVGNVTDPVVVHTNSIVQREISITTGWNWISFNLEFSDNSLDSALASLNHPENDLIKGQAQFAEYFGDNWLGSLTELGNTGMYQFRADQPDTILMNGKLIDPDSLSIPVVDGWNWIGYLPNNASTVDNALASLSPSDGDLIKGQESFAQYVNGTGWIGSLKFLKAPQGYQIRMSNLDTISYPGISGSFTSENPDLLTRSWVSDFWEIDATRFEYSSTITGYYSRGEKNVTTEDHEIGVFVNGELRGATKSIYITSLDIHLFFLTMFANEPGELLEFKIYNDFDASLIDMQETFTFQPSMHQGSVEHPIPFSEISSVVKETQLISYFEVFPNPFSQIAHVEFHSDKSTEAIITVLDAFGKVHLRQEVDASSGVNNIELQLQKLIPGMYFIRLSMDDGAIVRKIIKG
ncbi:MAG: hypothetical protein DRI69_01460, partial [Bacteroidetes bacterium]